MVKPPRKLTPAGRLPLNTIDPSLKRSEACAALFVEYDGLAID
jgi:hypothetical protein